MIPALEKMRMLSEPPSAGRDVRRARGVIGDWALPHVRASLRLESRQRRCYVAKGRQPGFEVLDDLLLQHVRRQIVELGLADLEREVLSSWLLRLRKSTNRRAPARLSPSEKGWLLITNHSR